MADSKENYKRDQSWEWKVWQDIAIKDKKATSQALCSSLINNMKLYLRERLSQLDILTRVSDHDKIVFL